MQMNNLYVRWCKEKNQEPKDLYAFKCMGGANNGSEYIKTMRGSGERAFVACTVDLLEAGVDIERLNAVVFFRYLKSAIKFYQMVGRGTRIHEETGKYKFWLYDYVVLKGRPGVVDSRWFYYWLRSPLGERCIQSLARGAVRERMLFNRLAEGEIELPDYETQVKASKALAQIKPMRAAIRKQIAELELLPQKLLAQVFES